MEWVLILVLSATGSNIAMASIPGFRTRDACMATLENAKKSAEEKYKVSALVAGEMYRYSICVEKRIK